MDYDKTMKLSQNEDKTLLDLGFVKLLKINLSYFRFIYFIHKNSSIVLWRQVTDA